WAGVGGGGGRGEADAGDGAAALQWCGGGGEGDQSLADRYPACRYCQACSLALMVPIAAPDRRESLASQAVETLRRSFAAGYSNAENLRFDPDLDALRHRDDFRGLLLDLAFPAEPFARGR